MKKQIIERYVYILLVYINMWLIWGIFIVVCIIFAIIGSCKNNNKNNKNNKKYNTIPIVHKDDSNLIAEFMGASNHINTKTHVNFIKTYDTLDKNKNIYIIMHTTGGSLSSSEAICNCILNHKGEGKIICVIPYYAYSGGCCIALCCDEIKMDKNAIVGPCDGQLSKGRSEMHSTAAIINAVNHKKQEGEKINVKWLISSYDAELCKKRQRKFMDNLIEMGKYTKETGDKIYDEFFSGIYNHDQIFTVKDLKSLGVNVSELNEEEHNLKKIFINH